MTWMGQSLSQSGNPNIALRRFGLFVALVLAALVAISGAGAGLDERLRLMRDMVRPHEASGKIMIVEIDARSIAAIADWPWPRRTHAALIDRLRADGATTIAFDVDFSARTNPIEDAALSDALKRAGGSVILPTFRQPVSDRSKRFSENMPIASLRAHAFLGSANVQPDADGLLRRYSSGTVTGGTSRPSIASMLANSGGNIDSSFRIDTALDPATIPRVSAIDVLRGKAPSVKGRAVLIGATAIEMGDRYIVPGHGVLPGVVVQALATETLISGSSNPDWGPWPALFIAVLVSGLCVWKFEKRSYFLAAATGSIVIVPGSLIVEIAKIGSVQIVPALVLLALEAIGVTLFGMRDQLRDSQLKDDATGLPNVRALERHCETIDDVAIMVVRLPQYEELTTILGDSDRALLMAQICNRLSVAFSMAVLHTIGTGAIAWADTQTIESDDADAAAALFRGPIMLATRAVVVSPVFGISRGRGTDAAHLIARASLAARQAQDTGQRWAFENTTLSHAVDRSIALIADVEQAIRDHEIYVVYQAKWDFAADRVMGAEALVRWHHPNFGPLSPDEFIPVLESNGQMRMLTLSVIDICLSQLHKWHARGNNIGIAINLSATLLDDHDFLAEVRTKLKARGSLASYITLEVTESATVASTKTAVDALTAFRALGARISIDDYGTGQATIAYLKAFPADEIKIDKSFVTNMLDNASDQIVVRSTIKLAHELGFKVVAEGVEDMACRSRLRDFGCDVGQGWAFGKPVRAEFFFEISKAA